MSHLFKRFINEKVLPLMSTPEKIRNCTIIAHIDHGKTTLSDSLLAASGLISRKLASELRYLDYDQIEQLRGITIKAASVCLSYSIDGTDFLINLIDTPGHIDFSGYVSRSLRVSDGAIVVIDAVEGIMVQTETVTRQALSELVKPIIFINKVDRLIKEKKLSRDQLLLVLNDIIKNFNAIIEHYKPMKIKEDWLVSFKKGTVAFGSAKHKWGINIYMLLEWIGIKEKTISNKTLLNYLLKFLDFVYSVYQKEDPTIIEKELSEVFPVERSVLEIVIHHLPSPVKAQKIRVKNLWSGNIASEIGRAMINCDQNGPTMLFVNEVQLDKHAGLIAFGRIFSGKIKLKQELLMLNLKDKFVVQNLFLFMGKSKIPVREVPVGNIVAIAGLKKIRIGETIASTQYPEIIPFEKLHYVTEPVVTYVVEPKHLIDLEKTKEIINLYVLTDPNLRFIEEHETGEMLLSGMGELHIEITIEKLKRFGVELEVSKPRVVYHETLAKPTDSIAGGSMDSSFVLYYKLIPIGIVNGKGVNQSKEELISHLEDILRRQDIVFDPNMILYYDKRYKNLILNSSGFDLTPIKKEFITAFNSIMSTGPLAYESCANILLVIENVKATIPIQNVSLIQINEALSSIHEQMLKAGMNLLEPWQKLEITIPNDFVGKVTDILNKRKGKIISIQQSQYLYKVVVEIPVRNTFGLSSELRSETRGYATWGAEFIGFKKVPDREYLQLLKALRQSKGLPESY